MKNNNWFRDEFIQIGTDYSDLDEVESYDKRMSFRDIHSENLKIIKDLGIKKDHIILEIGTGTGELAIELSKYSKEVHAIDVSASIIGFARSKARSSEAENIVFSNSGFLSMDYKKKFDFVITQFALHHLPDFWKAVALLNIAESLKAGGKFYLKDVIYSFDINDYEYHLNNWVTEFGNRGNPTKDIEVHIREEFSTFTWLIEEMIDKAGMLVEQKYYENGIIAEYICKK